MSEHKRFRYGIWAVVFFVLAVSIPGWFVQMRLLQKIGRLEKRVTELEQRRDSQTQHPALQSVSQPES